MGKQANGGSNGRQGNKRWSLIHGPRFLTVLLVISMIHVATSQDKMSTLDQGSNIIRSPRNAKTTGKTNTQSNRYLGASLKKSSPSYSPSQLLKALDIYQDILKQRILIALKKYQTKYFAKRQPYVNLQLIRLAQNNYSKVEQSDTAKGALFRICKLLSVFHSSVYLAWHDEGHGGSVAKTLKKLFFGIRDTLQTAMFLAKKLNYSPLPSGFRVSRESMDNRVIQYKKIFKDSASVNSIRSWRTLYEMKYYLINELVIQMKKLHNSLSM